MKHKLIALALILFVSLGLSAPAMADHSIQGKVVGVSDGDTITILDNSRTQHKIRLLGIDAPEKRQAFGQRSRQMLSELVFGEHVLADCIGKDRYDRNLCKIISDGEDINLAMVTAGMAWHYKMYAKNQVKTDRIKYAEAEEKAREKKAGLWRDPDPEAPWNFRRSKR